MRKILLSSILLLLFNLTLNAHSANRFNSFSIEEGLAGQLVRDIAQDAQGFIWFATAYGLSRYDGYSFKNFYHNELSDDSLSSNNLWQLYIDRRGVMWVVSDKGLDEYIDGRFIRHLLQSRTLKRGSLTNTNRFINSVTSETKNLWIGTDDGLIQYFYQKQQEKIHLKGIKIRFLLSLPNGEIVAATDDGLYRKNLSQHKFNRWNFGGHVNPKNINKLHIGPDNVIWAVNKESLFKIDIGGDNYSIAYPEISEHIIQSIASNTDTIWLGTIRNGLYKIYPDGSIRNFKYEAHLNDSISENVIASLLLDRNSTLWIGTFGSGVNYRDIRTELFGLHESKDSHLSCLKGRSINFIDQTAEGKYTLGTNEGAYQIDVGKNSCNSIEFNNGQNDDLDSFIVYSGYKRNAEEFYFGHSRGVTLYNPKERKKEQLFPKQIKNAVYFIQPFKKSLLLGTYFNIYSFDIEKKTLSVYKTMNSEKRISVGASWVDFLENEKLIFASTAGLLVSNASGTLVPLSPNGHKALNNPISALLVDDEYIWVGNDNDHSIYQFNKMGKLIHKYPLSEAISNIRPVSIMSNNNYLWIGSTQGLFQLNKDSKRLKRYTKNDGLQSDIFNRNSAFRSFDGKLLFGGKQGFNEFVPKELESQSEAPKVVLTELRLFNKLVGVATDNANSTVFKIEKPIELLKSLTLSHRDYVFSIQFAALHFSDSARNQYAYKLEGLHQEWIYSDDSNRVASFTSLSVGDYIFRVKASNKDGVWSSLEDQAVLRIKVLPAPWLSWWAFSIYGIVGTLLLVFFIRLKTQSAVKRADYLEIEVLERTKEIQVKKNVIELLLEQKNTQFANISHEFRTPLTLILGPLERELQALERPKNPKRLKMIQRNAARLLGMVEQILKLTELKQEQQVKKIPHALNPIVEVTVESFKFLAEKKNIDLSLVLDDDCNVLAANDAIIIMLGNLISNAIKYTPYGGLVQVSSLLLGEQVTLTITDNGLGMEPSQQKEVFDRFVRLNGTSDTTGTGIGLSIVSELVRSHDGRVSIESQKGKGSSFTITLPTTKGIIATNQETLLQPIIHLTQIEDTIIADNEQVLDNLNKLEDQIADDKVTVLIIEDNSDMQEYIRSVLTLEYSCLCASHGSKGIELAIEQVPNLIVCDVMMPGISGYEVARNLRNEERTSHIPIVLLTAKGDKKSRIKGWDENIDAYMTKPFDEQELLVRIANILSIRNIIRDNAYREFSHQPEALDKVLNAEKNRNEDLRGLNHKEQAFIEKLMLTIKNNYADSSFHRIHLASKMAVSERQLHRKVHALLNQHPIEILREFRLKTAIKMLKMGEPVGQVSEQCGFSSPSYFSQCFKARFGVTPTSIVQARLQ